MERLSEEDRTNLPDLLLSIIDDWSSENYIDNEIFEKFSGNKKGFKEDFVDLLKKYFLDSQKFAYVSSFTMDAGKINWIEYDEICQNLLNLPSIIDIERDQTEATFKKVKKFLGNDKKLLVRIYKPQPGYLGVFKECSNFLKTRKSIELGAAGLALIALLASDKIPQEGIASIGNDLFDVPWAVNNNGVIEFDIRGDHKHWTSYEFLASFHEIK